MNLVDNLLATAKEHPDRIAIRLDDAVLTYEQLQAATRAVAGLLDGCGVRAGDRVGIMLPNVAHFAILYYGILRIGAIVVPMNPLLKEREVADYLSDSGTKVVFAWHRSIDEATAGAKLADTYAFMVEPSSFKHVLASSPVLDQITEREDADAAVIRYTSATTGHPKRAELTHGDLAPDVEVALADLIQVT